MTSDHQPTDSSINGYGTVPFHSEHGGTDGCDYLMPAPPVEVMREQFDYLVHHGGDCRPDCVDCARLGEITRSLLRPFS